MANYAKLTNEQRNRIAELYATGKYTHKRLASMFGVGNSTICRIASGGADVSEKKVTCRRFTPEEDEIAVRLYREGKQLKEIGDILGRDTSSIYGRLSLLGIHTSKKNSANLHVPAVGSSMVKMSEAIYPEDLIDIRKKVKVDDIIQVRTMKAMTEAMGTGAVGNGVIRDARVISVDHPRFCLVKLVETGFIETILWVDMVIAQRRRELAEAEFEIAGI